jgi:hypothetical protein
MTQDPRGEEPPYGWPSKPGSFVDNANRGRIPYRPVYNPVASGTVYTEALAKNVLYYWLFRIIISVALVIFAVFVFLVSCINVEAGVLCWAGGCVLMFLLFVWLMCRFIAGLFRSAGRRY